MTSWNDDRLDKRDEELKEGFARLERQMADGFAETNERFNKVDERFTKVDERFIKVEERLAQMATRQEMNENVAKLEAQIRAGVAQSNERFVMVESHMENGFAEMRSAYTTLTRTMFLGAIGVIAALIGVVGALLT